MDHFTCYLCADSSFSIEPVASLWHTKLSSLAGRSMHRAAVDAFVVLRVCDLFDLAEISSSRVYFACLGDHRIFRLSLGAAFWHYVDSLLKSFALCFPFPCCAARVKAGTLFLMGTALIILLVLLCGAGLLALFGIGKYNSLVALGNRYKNGFSQIDVQLKRRYDLVANLVEIAKGYLKHERETLEAVISARNSAYSAGAKAAANPGDPKAMRDLTGAEAGLSGALGRLFAVAEAYPDLKANQNMLQLSEELTSTENKISFARQAYNDAVMAYNTQREVFPARIIANMFNFAAAELLQIQNTMERETPKASFT